MIFTSDKITYIANAPPKANQTDQRPSLFPVAYQSRRALTHGDTFDYCVAGTLHANEGHTLSP